MSLVPRFGAYAAAFEKAYASDDWSVVAPFFTEDAVYEVGLGPPLGGRFEGRDAVLAYFKAALDGFDRRFATRSVHLLEGPEERDGAVWIRGRAVYTAAGLPDLGFALEEIATFEGDRIRHLEDRYPASEREAIERYMAAHGDRLGLGMG
ncbi:MAG: nuclear transport factor 2 family protein [Myxococcota bacterium]|nr:nuclear transport factor 2 family protein [Myxococcota bacterium]